MKPLLIACFVMIGSLAAGAAATQPVIPPPSADYAKWAGLWDQSRQMEAEVACKRHEIAFLRVMEALNLSKDQMEKMLPMARKARDEGRLVTADFVAFLERVDRVKQEFADDIKVEDLVPKAAGRKTINGNFDLEIWNAAAPFRHPFSVSGPKIGEARERVRRSGEELDKILTPEQLKLYADNSNADATKNDLTYYVRGLQATWIHAHNFVPISFIGTLNTGNSIAGFNTPSTGLLLAPNAVSYLEAKLGMPISADPAAKEAQEQVARAYYLARLERRIHRRGTVPENWMKGAVFTQKQHETFARIAGELLPLYIAEEQQWQAKVSEYLAMLDQLKALAEKNQPVPAALADSARALGSQYVGNYWSGAVQGGTCAEDGTFRARKTAIWAMFPQQTEKLLAEADAALGENQKIVIWDVHGECYQPWRVFTNPVNAGEPAEGQLEDKRLTKLRAVPLEQADAEMKAVVQAQLVETQKRQTAAKKPLTDDQLAAEQARLGALLVHVRQMTDAEYELCKTGLVYEMTGCPEGCGFVNDPGGLGTPEQNGQWPKPDWNSKEVKEKWEARLENLVLPEVLPFHQTRAMLMRQFQPAPPADLEKLPKAP